MLRLRVFGGLSIENHGCTADIAARRRPLALLALLGIAGEAGLRREKAVALLWPESDEERGRNSLSQALTALRRDFAVDDVVAGTSELRLNPNRITSDVQEFEARVASGELESAASIYQGPFLDGFFIKESAEFERWTEENRRRLQQMHGVVLEKLARRAGERGDHQSAIAWWRKLATQEPTSAQVAVGLMEALTRAGDRAGALQYFRVHQALLQQELSVEPDAVVTDLAARLQRVNGRDDVPPPPPQADAAPSHAAPVTEVQPPRRRKLVRGYALAPLAVIVATVLLALRWTREPKAHDRRRVVVTHFANRTGDPSLDLLGPLAATSVTNALQHSGLLEAREGVTALAMVSGTRGSTAALEAAQEVQRAAASARASFVIGGEYFRDGDSIVFLGRVFDGRRGTPVAATEAARAPAATPDAALERVRQRLLGMLAIRLDERFRDVLTPGLTSEPTVASYTEFVNGLLRFQERAFEAAIAHFDSANALDSTFLTPLYWQVFAFGYAGKDSARLRTVARLARHRERMTPLERHALGFLEAPRGDREAQVAALEQASRIAPGSIWTQQLGATLHLLERFTEAVAALEMIDRKHSWTRRYQDFWTVFVECLHHTGDYRRELEIAREGRAVLPRGNLVLVHREARALAALGRKGELQQVIGEIEVRPDSAQWLGFFLDGLAAELWSRGDTLYARELSDRAISWLRATVEARPERDFRRTLAMALYDGDHWDEALPMFQGIVATNPRDWQALMFAGLCYAHTGDRGAAEDILARLVATADSGQWGDRSLLGGNFYAAARIAAALGDRERAVRLLKAHKDHGHFWLSRHLLSKLSKDFHQLLGYPSYMAITTLP